jgi:hypothetical protein
MGFSSKREEQASGEAFPLAAWGVRSGGSHSSRETLPSEEEEVTQTPPVRKAEVSANGRETSCGPAGIPHDKLAISAQASLEKGALPMLAIFAEPEFLLMRSSSPCP